MTPIELVNLAKEARSHAYVPYSGFSVGAALLCKDGKIYQGCNIENAAFGPTVCAERTAFFKAVYDGERDFEAIAVVGGRAGEEITGLFPPCGVCRQVMQEFSSPSSPGSPDFQVILAKADGFDEYSLSDLLPLGFTL